MGIVIVKIKYLSNKKNCILAKWRTTEKRDLERYGSSLWNLKSRKVSGSSIGCHKLVAAWVIASLSWSRSKRKYWDVSCQFATNIPYRWIFGSFWELCQFLWVIMLPSFKQRFVSFWKNGLGSRNEFLWASKGRFPVSFSILKILLVSVARMDHSWKWPTFKI